jgi:hypothetical protein
MKTITQKDTEIEKTYTAVKRVSVSQCMQKIFECLAKQILLAWMLISKRCYQGFIPPVFGLLSIFEPKLLRIFEKSSSFEIFSHTCLAWERNYVCRAGENLESARQYFEGKD